MWVCLFDDDGAETRHQLTEHTLGVWHGADPRRAGRAAATASAPTGPWDPAHGQRFNPAKLLLDPYARAVDRRGRATARRPSPATVDGDPSRPSTLDSAAACRAAWSSHDDFDWGDDRPAAHAAGATR